MKVIGVYCIEGDGRQMTEMIQSAITERIQEAVSIENQLDTEHANELRNIRVEFNERLQSQLNDGKERTARDLYRWGNTLVSTSWSLTCFYSESSVDQRDVFLAVQESAATNLSRGWTVKKMNLEN